MKLGKQAAKLDPRTLKLGRYFLDSLPPAPPKVTWSKGAPGWGMMVNNQRGCCTIAGAFHQAQVWQLNTTGRLFSVQDGDVLHYYSKWDGFDPNNPDATDQGGVELDVLNKWRTEGLLSTKLVAYADPDEKNLNHVKQAINLFGGVYIGLELPITAQTQMTWDVPTFKTSASANNSWGGHCVCVPDYDDEEKVFTCITWGVLKQMTYKFFLQYCDEAHALLSPDWLKEGKTTAGFDLNTLLDNLKQVTA